MKKFFIIIITFLAISNPVWSKHILGGTMSYKYLENDNYEITLYVLRDAASGGAGFDEPAPIGIYKCGFNILCDNLDQFNAFLKPNPNTIDITSIQLPVYLNLTVPSNNNVELGKYVFTVNLPESKESYFIAYQRCCRNIDEINVDNPTEVGITYMIEITPIAQKLHNSSPIFIKDPLSSLCVNEVLNYDHSAIDIDGDSLVYEFCSPLSGGGSGGSGNGCNSVTPNPSCPPPYLALTYNTSFTIEKPFGESAVSIINNSTGLLNLKPNQLGLFCNAICVKEYRNGSLLSTTIREMATRVQICYPLSTTSLNDKSNFNLKFNNPIVSGVLSINFLNYNLIEISSIEVMNSQGNLIYDHFFESNPVHFECQLKFLLPGLYILKTTSKDHNTFLKKFIVQ